MAKQKEELEQVWDKHLAKYLKNWSFNARDLRDIEPFSDTELKNLEIGDTPLFKWLHEHKNQNLSLLDAGCGCGFFSIYSKKIGYSPIGIDISKQSIIASKKLAKLNQENINFIAGDVRKMPFSSKKFDIVLSSGVIEHFSDTENAIEEHSRVLKKDGLFIGNVPYRFTIFVLNKFFLKLLGKWDPGYEKSFSIKKIKNLFQKHKLDLIKIIRQPIRPGGKFPLYGKILGLIEKPFFFTGFGGMHIYFLAKKR